MIDLQSTPDHRGIGIDRVGVKGLRYPIKVRTRDGGFQQTIADFGLFVDLHPKYRGTHMSRFIEALDRFAELELTAFTIPDLLNDLRRRLDAETAEVEVGFPYFIRKSAPVSGKSALVDYRCHFVGQMDGTLEFRYGVTTPVTTLCPCSKEISDYGAHNQRSEVTLSIRSTESNLIWFEEMIEWVEACASAPVYSLLKREDEKFVTEQAYDNPVFVEDVVRALAEKLNANHAITWFRISSENFESIHNHNAFAMIERSKE